MTRRPAWRGLSIEHRRIAPLALAAILSLAAIGSAIGSAHPGGEVAPVPSLADRLGSRTWALGIPITWLAAPIPGLRADDVVDLLGTRNGERATSTEIASGLRVMSVDDRALVVELTEADASAIASARARGVALIPILRSRR